MSRTLRSLLLLGAALPTGAIGADFQQTQKIAPSIAGADDLFGVSVATDGKLTAVGAHRRTDPPTAPGFVTLFRGCNPMIEDAILTASDAAPGDEFGRVVAIDGDRMLVGARRSLPSGMHVGAAYVFRNTGSQWQQEAKLVPSNGLPGDLFGTSVALRGEVAVVGAPGHGNGAAYVFRFDGAQWKEQELTSGDIYKNGFGTAVAMDGDRIAIGAIYDTPGSWVGRVFLFRDNGAGGWSDDGVAEPSLASQLDAGDYFGASVALAGDSLLVGCPGDKDAQLQPNQGSVYAFRFDGTKWVETQKIVPPSAVAGDSFGWVLARDGDTAVVTAYLDDTAAPDAGAAYILRFDGEEWVTAEKITTSDASGGDKMYGAAIRGGTLVVGTTRDDDHGLDSGSAYLFRDSISTYGSGVAGAGNIKPTLDATGAASPGGNVTVQVRDFVGGGAAILLIGLAPADVEACGGGRLLVDTTLFHVAATFALPGAPGLAGAGDVDLPVFVPSSAAISCASFYCQAISMDSTTLCGVALTNGLVVSLD